MRAVPSLLFAVAFVPALASAGCHAAVPQGSAASTNAAPRSVERGPVSLPFDPGGDGDPTSLVWDEASASLYVADGRHARIWRWDEAHGFAPVGSLPAAAAGEHPSVGQLVRLGDGTLLLPRFGFGEHGGVAFLAPGGATGELSGMRPERRRIALAVGAGDTLWSASFLHPKGSAPIGTVSRVTRAGGEVDYAAGFQKPVGLLVHDGKLLVSDQAAGAIYALPLEGAHEPHAVYAKVEGPDTLAEGPDGTVLTGQFRPARDGEPLAVRRISPDGRVAAVPSPLALTKPKGIACDRAHRRLFVADSDGRAVRTVKILPL